MNNDRSPESPPAAPGAAGEPAAALIAGVYAELRHIAARLMRREHPGHVLQPTALVNEAYLRLPAAVQADSGGRSRLIGRLVMQMKWALLDHAREVAADKRPHPRLRVTLDQEIPAAEDNVVDLLDVCRALSELERLNERHCRVFELRFFGGFSVAEVAELLETSARTVKYDWQFAIAWIAARLDGETPR